MNTERARQILRHTFDRLAELEERRKEIAAEMRDLFETAAAALAEAGLPADVKAVRELYRRHAKMELQLRRRVEQLELALGEETREAA